MLREVRNASQKEATAFLRSHRKRTAISEGIFRTVIPDDDGRTMDKGNGAELSMPNKFLSSPDNAGEFSAIRRSSQTVPEVPIHGAGER